MSIVQEKMYMDVDDVCAILGVSKAYAYGWGSSTIVNILKKREYLGHTINFKTRKHFKDKARRLTHECCNYCNGNFVVFLHGIVHTHSRNIPVAGQGFF